MPARGAVLIKEGFPFQKRSLLCRTSSGTPRHQSAGILEASGGFGGRIMKAFHVFVGTALAVSAVAYGSTPSGSPLVAPARAQIFGLQLFGSQEKDKDKDAPPADKDK